MLDSNNKFRLQLLNHDEVFATRELAEAYIADYLKPDVLLAEPAVVYYGEKNSPNVILAIGSGNRKVFSIDLAKINEDLSDLSSKGEESVKEVDKALKTIKNIIEVCGLNFDDNKKENQVSYEPDSKDEVIGDVKTIAEAINVLSKYVQEVGKSAKFTVSDTNSVKLIYKEDEENGSKTLKAKIKISDSGDNDDEVFNDNIIGVKTDGLFAAVHLEYNEDRNELTFTTSGVKNGRFQDDARKNVIKLGKHSEIEAKNSDSNPVKVDIESDGNVKKVSARIDLSERDNILKISDGKLTANVTFDYNQATNELIFNNGIQTKTIKLNVGGIVDTVYYDSLTENLIIKFKLSDGTSSEVKIPVRHILNEWGVDNTNTTVTLVKTVNTGDGQDILTANVNISSNKDNILVSDGNSLYVGGTSDNIRHEETTVASALNSLNSSVEKNAQDLINEINTRTNEIEKVLKKIEQETKDRKHADKDIQKSINELDIDGLRSLVNEFKTTYDEFEKEWAVYKAQIEQAIKDASSVIERVTKLEKDFAVTNTKLDTLTERVIAVEGLNDKVNGLSDTLTSANGEISSLKERVSTAEGNINNQSSKIADNSLAIINEAALARQNETDIKKSLENEINRSIAKDEELAGNIASNKSDIETAKSNISSLQNDLTAEVERAKGVESTFNETLNGVKSTVEENKTNLGVISTSVSGLRNELENEVIRAQGEEKRLAEKINTLTDSSTAASNNALEQAKNYTDAEVLKAKTASAEDATSKTNQALADAKSYSDEKLALEVERAKASEQSNADAIAELKTKNADIESNLANKVENVRVEKNSQSDLQYTLYVDDKPAGEINIPKDQFLKDVRYDVGTKSLVFTWELPDHPETSVDISDFLTTYVAGEGLQLTENIFSVKLTTANESYLQVTSDGIQLVGIDAKFDTKADKTDVYTKLEVDNAVEAEAIRAKGIEDGLKNSIETTNSDLTNLTDRVSETESKLNIVQGNFAQEGSIANAIYQSKNYTDEKISEVNSVINEKANSSDVYTKTEIDNKGYLTSSDIENLANKSEVETEKERAISVEEGIKQNVEAVKENVSTNTNNIVQLQKDVASLEPSVLESNSVKMVMNKSANGTEFSSDVKLDLEKSNIIKVSGNGIYAEVSLEYITSENKLVFNAGGTSKELQLAGASMLQDAYYSSATRQLIFVVTLQGGETKQVTVDVNDLINTLRVENPANSPVQLILNRDAQGNDLLSANIIISTKEDNGILADNGTLFVSKRAANMTALWEDNLDTNLQVVINNLKTRTDGIEGLTNDVNNLKTEVSEAKLNITNIQNQITNINEKVENQGEKITKIEGSVDTFGKLVNDLSEKVSSLEKEVNGYTQSINDIKEATEKIQKMIGDNSGNSETIFERLNRIDTIINNLIDFGAY